MSIFNSLMFSMPNSFINTLRKKTIIFTSFISRLGYAVTIAEIYHNIDLPNYNKVAFIKFKVSKKKSRDLKMYFLAVSHQDLVNIEGKDVRKIVKDDRELIILFTHFLKKFTLVHSNLYKKLMIRLSSQSYFPDFQVKNSKIFHENLSKISPFRVDITTNKTHISPSYNIPIKMTNFIALENSNTKWGEKIVEKFEQDKSKSNFLLFLKPETKISKIVGKFVLKIDKNFAIASLFISDSSENVTLKIYFPKSKRVIVTLFDKRQIQLCKNFVEKMIKKKIEDIEKYEKFKNFMEGYKGQYFGVRGDQKNVVDFDDIQLRNLGGEFVYFKRKKDGGFIRTEEPEHQKFFSEKKLITKKIENENLLELFKNPKKSYKKFLESTFKLFKFNSERESCTFSGVLKIALNSWSSMSERDLTKLEKMKNKKKAKKFHSRLYWENILETLKIERRKRNKTIIRANEHSSISREEIFGKEVIIKSEVFYLEILLENEQNPNDSILENFGNFTLGNLQGIYFFVKLRNLSRGYERNDKINLLKAIEIIEIREHKGDVEFKGKNIQSLLKKDAVVNINSIRRIAAILVEMIIVGLEKLFGEKNRDIKMKYFQKNFSKKRKSKNSQKKKNSDPFEISLKKSEKKRIPRPNSNSVPTLHLTHSIKMLINPKKRDFMNLHSRICTILNLSETDNFILLYKSRFTNHPERTIIWIMYKVEVKKIYTVVYNLKNQKFKKKIFSLGFIQNFIPYFERKIREKEFFEMGRRLFLALKNVILMSYLRTGDNENPEVSEDNLEEVFQEEQFSEIEGIDISDGYSD